MVLQTTTRDAITPVNCTKDNFVTRAYLGYGFNRNHKS